MIIFDTETTGLLKPKIAPLDMQPKIIEFAAVKIKDKSFNIEDQIEFLVNPGEKLDPKITKLTGITDDDLKGKLYFKDHYAKIKRFFKDEKVIIAHNVMFDINVLKYELERIGKLDDFPMPERRLCTVNKSMYLRGKRLKLGHLYSILTGKQIEGAHRAINDVYALTKCVQVMHQNNRI